MLQYNYQGDLKHLENKKQKLQKKPKSKKMQINLLRQNTDKKESYPLYYLSLTDCLIHLYVKVLNVLRLAQQL
jgi:hypothetical protein